MLKLVNVKTVKCMCKEKMYGRENNVVCGT
jgi:hypothetical protein